MSRYTHLLIFFICTFTLLAIDSRFGFLIPLRTFTRYVVPALFLLALITDFNNIRTIHGKWIWSIFILCVVSAFYSLAPVICMAKVLFFMPLVLYLGMPGTLTGGFYLDERVRGFACFAYLFLLLAISLMQFTTGFFPSQNALSAVGLSSLPFVLLAWDQLGRLRWLYMAIPVLVTLLGLSRSGAIAVIFCLTTFHILRRRNFNSNSALIGIAVVSVALVMLISVSGVADSLIYKDGDEIFDEARQLMTEEVLEVIWESPLLGWGFGLSWRFQPEHVPLVQRTGRLSFYVGEFGNLTYALIGSGGLTLVVLFYGWMLAVIASALRKLNWIEHQGKTVCVASISGVIGLLVFSQGEAALISPFSIISPTFWLLVGLANYSVLSFSTYQNDLQNDGPNW